MYSGNSSTRFSQQAWLTLRLHECIAGVTLKLHMQIAAQVVCCRLRRSRTLICEHQHGSHRGRPRSPDSHIVDLVPCKLSSLCTNRCQGWIGSPFTRAPTMGTRSVLHYIPCCANEEVRECFQNVCVCMAPHPTLSLLLQKLGDR
jgi:hypothetical protein